MVFASWGFHLFIFFNWHSLDALFIFQDGIDYMIFIFGAAELADRMKIIIKICLLQICFILFSRHGYFNFWVDQSINNVCDKHKNNGKQGNYE